MLATSPPFAHRVLQDCWQHQQQAGASSPLQLLDGPPGVTPDTKLRELASMASLSDHPLAVASPLPPPLPRTRSPAAAVEPWTAASDSPSPPFAARSPPRDAPARLSNCNEALPSPIPTPPCMCYSRLPAGCASDPHAPTVKYIGVRLRGRSRWVAEIKDNNHGVRKWLGTFACPVQAAQAFDAAARAIRGPKTKANFKRGDPEFVEQVPEVLEVLAYCGAVKPLHTGLGLPEPARRPLALLPPEPSPARPESPKRPSWLSMPAPAPQGVVAAPQVKRVKTSPSVGPSLASAPSAIPPPSTLGSFALDAPAISPARAPQDPRAALPTPPPASAVAATRVRPLSSHCVHASPLTAFPHACADERAVKVDGAAPSALLPAVLRAEAHAGSEPIAVVRSAELSGRVEGGWDRDSAAKGAGWLAREPSSARSARGGEQRMAVLDSQHVRAVQWQSPHTQHEGRRSTRDGHEGADEGVGAPGMDFPSLWSPCGAGECEEQQGEERREQHQAYDMQGPSAGKARLGKRRSPEPADRPQVGNCLLRDGDGSMAAGRAGVLSLLSVGALQSTGERVGGRLGGESLKMKGISLASLMPVADHKLTPEEFGELRQRLGWKVVRMEDLEEIPRVAREALLRFREPKDSTMLSL